MLEWLSQISWTDVLTKGQAIADSNFTTALVGSLAGAFGGAWAAQRIAERSKVREELLREIRHTNATSSMVYGIANAHLGLKSQHIQALHDKYLEERGRLDLFLNAKQAGRVPPQQRFEFNADLQTLKPLLSPTDQIQRLMFDQISITGAVLFVLPVLLATMQSLSECLNDRNRLVEDWKVNRPKDIAEMYFGLRYNDMVDERYKTLVEGIYRQTDDVIAFSTMIGDALYNHAIAQRQKLRDQFHIDGPLVTKIDLSRFEKFIPPPKEYENFAKMFEITKTKAPKKLDIFRPAPTAIVIAVIGAAAILGAYFFQYVIKLAPCPLCLEQRIPYYIGIPLALIVAFAASKQAPKLLIELGFAALVLVFLYGAGLGVYHAGIEWKFWAGPTECTGPLNPFGTGGDLLSQIQNTSVVRCDEAAWRLFGLSLAGYNVLISLALAAIAFLAARPGAKS